MKSFDYYEPQRLEEACALLERFNGRARVLAGGTDLLVQLKDRSLDLDAIINIKKIDGMNQIRFDPRQGIHIGPLVTWTQLLESEAVTDHFPILRQAAESMASMQIRNVATLAGNICHASPAANGATALLLYQAHCVATGPQGDRTFPVRELFAGPQENTLRTGELLSGISIPLPPADSRGTYIKFSLRRAMDLALVSVGTLIKISNGTFDEARLALGALAPTPFRAEQAEKVLVGETVEDGVIRKAAETAAGECSAITDIRSSKDYRLELAENLVYRAIKECSVTD